MREQDFIPERPKRSGRVLVPSKLRGAAAAAASASSLAVCSFVFAVLPPVPAMAAVAEGLQAAAAFA